MRVHKYRAIPRDPEEYGVGFVYGDIIRDECGVSSIILPVEAQLLSDLFSVKPETVGEFTGLTDSNKREAYEDDVYYCDSSLYQIYWNKTLARFDIKEIDHPKIQSVRHLGYLLKYGEHKGNAHQNPELLNPNK